MSLIKYLYCFVVLFVLGTHLKAQQQLADGGSLEYNIEKCSRLQAGGVFSQYNFLDENYGIYGFHLQHNYCIKTSKYNGFGIGGGLSIYSKNTFLPIVLEHIHCTPGDLFYVVQAGYAFAWNQQTEYFNEYNMTGGINGGLGFGYKFKKGEPISMCLQLSYNYQQTCLSKTGVSAENVGFHQILLTLGLLLEKK